MAFPTDLDTAATVGGDSLPAPSTSLNEDPATSGHPSHSDLHENVGDAVQAVEAKIGTGASTPATNTVLTGTASGTSAWATVDTAMISADAIDGTKIADDSINSEHYVDGSIDEAHLADDAVTAAKIHDDAVTKVVVADTTDTSCSVALFESATGSLPPKTDDGLTYNASNGTLTATAFAGPLTGNVTGNADTATTAATATTVTLTDEGSDTTCFPVFSQTATGNRALETDASALTYNASNGNLSATTLTASSALNGDSLSITAGASVGGTITASSGSESTPSISFTGDTDTGIYRSAADTMQLVAGGNGSAVVTSDGFALDLGVNFSAWPDTGTGNDAEWVATGFGNFILKRNSSLRSEKENIQDPGDELTADMIDQVEPKLWNRIHSPGIPEIGPIAEDMEAISPHLGAHGFNEDGTTFLTGINKTTYLSLLVLAVKDLRTQVADLTTRLEAVEG